MSGDDPDVGEHLQLRAMRDEAGGEGRDRHPDGEIADHRRQTDATRSPTRPGGCQQQAAEFGDDGCGQLHARRIPARPARLGA